MNFRELIDREARDADPTVRPRSMPAMAEQCGISRTHLYNLFSGAKVAPAWTVAKIAGGLGLDVEVVQEAVHRSRMEALGVGLT